MHLKWSKRIVIWDGGSTNDFVKTLKGSADKPKQATSVGKIPTRRK